MVRVNPPGSGSIRKSRTTLAWYLSDCTSPNSTVSRFSPAGACGPS